MTEFVLLKPKTPEEAIELSSQHETSTFLAGGTDLLVNRRRGIGEHPVLIDLSQIKGLQEVVRQPSGHLHIGAGVTLATLATNKQIKDEFPLIATAAKSIAGPTHRQTATVGGNICLDTRCIYYNQSEWWRQSNNYCLKYKGEVCHVSPKSKTCLAAFSGDLAPAFLALGATANLIGPDGGRSIPLDDLYIDNGAAHLALHTGEFILSFDIPSCNNLTMDYQKVSVREAIDFPLAGVAVVIDRENDKLQKLAIAFTGLNSRPVLLDQLEGLIGQSLDHEALEQIAGQIKKQVKPMQSTTYRSGYRKTIAETLAIDTLTNLWEVAATT